MNQRLHNHIRHGPWSIRIHAYLLNTTIIQGVTLVFTWI